MTRVDGNLIDVHGVALGGRTVSWSITDWTTGATYNGTVTTASDGSFSTGYAFYGDRADWTMSFAGDAYYAPASATISYYP